MTTQETFKKIMNEIEEGKIFTDYKIKEGDTFVTAENIKNRETYMELSKNWHTYDYNISLNFKLISPDDDCDNIKKDAYMLNSYVYCGSFYLDENECTELLEELISNLEEIQEEKRKFLDYFYKKMDEE